MRVQGVLLALMMGLLVAGSAMSVKCEESSSAPTAVESRGDSKKSDDKKFEDKKKDELTREEKIRLEQKARRQVERRERYERRRRHRHDDGGVIIVTDGGDPDGGHEESAFLGFTGGLVYAPGSGGRRGAFGVQCIGWRGWGVGAWISEGVNDLIDNYIPHDDYHTETSTGSYGAQVLYLTGSNNVDWIFGAGLAIEEVQYMAVSNVTGWRFDDGTENAVKPAASIGCRLRLGSTMGLNLGYDTHQSGYFGLSAEF